jgi:hypothetical protein
MTDPSAICTVTFEDWCGLADEVKGLGSKSIESSCLLVIEETHEIILHMQ